MMQRSLTILGFQFWKIVATDLTTRSSEISVEMSFFDKMRIDEATRSVFVNQLKIVYLLVNQSALLSSIHDGNQTIFRSILLSVKKSKRGRKLAISSYPLGLKLPMCLFQC